MAAVPAFLIVGLVTVASVAGVVRTSLREGVLGERGYGLAAWRRVFGDEAFADSVVFTLWVAGAATALAVVGAATLSIALRNHAGWARSVLALPVAAPHLVVAALAMVWLAPGGLAERLVGSLPVTLTGDSAGVGIVLVYAWKEIPFLTILGLASLDRATLELESSTAMVGASRWQRARDVLLPRLAVPMAAGGLVVAAFVIGAVEVPLVVGPTRPDMLGPYALDVVRIDGPVARSDAAVAHVIAALVVGVIGLCLGLATRRRWSR